MDSNVHFIGIDDPSIAALAVGLHQQGYLVTVSQLLLNALSKSFYLQNITDTFQRKDFSKQDIIPNLPTCVVVSNGLDLNNLEIKAAKKVGLPIYTYTHYIYHCARNKQRILAIGSPSMTQAFLISLQQVLGYYKRPFDYAMLPVFSNSISLTVEAPFILFESDNPLKDGAIYQPHILLILGESMHLSSLRLAIDGYAQLVKLLPKAGILLCSEDFLRSFPLDLPVDVKYISYKPFQNYLATEVTHVTTPQGKIPLQSTHEPQVLAAAQQLLQELALSPVQFYAATTSLLG